MKKVKMVLATLVVLVFAGGFALLAVSDIPVKTVEIRKTIPNEQFFQKN